MELIKPGDPDPAQQEQLKEAERAHTFKADFTTRPGWMLLEVNIGALAQSVQAQWQFMGFMDDHKGRAMQIVARIVADAREQQTEVLKAQVALEKTQSKNGFASFLRSKLKH